MASMKRRLELTTENIFAGRTFYLDLRRNPQLRSHLEHGIRSLKGDVKEFLENTVKYVVTDKPFDEWPEVAKLRQLQRNRRIQANHQAALQRASSNHNQPNGHDQDHEGAGDQGDKGEVTLTNHADVADGANTTVNVSVVVQPQDQLTTNQVDMFSRGKLLLKAAGAVGQTSTVTTHVHEPTAQQILNTPFKSNKTDVLDTACERGMKLVKATEMLIFIEQRFKLAQQADHEENESNGYTKSQKVIRLDSPYVKVEVLDQRHRPFWKVFPVWPSISFDSDSVGSPFAPPAKKPKAEKKQDKDPKIPKRPLVLNNKKRAPQYCELCGVEYDHISEHVQSQQHESLARNSENWKEVSSVLLSIPTLNDLISETEEHLSQQSSASATSPLISPTTTRTSQTITLASLTSRNNNKFINLNKYINGFSSEF